MNLGDLAVELGGASAGAKVVLLDCCRQRPAKRAAGSQGVEGGGLATYAEERIPADTLMILAAAPNKLASDGQEHGPLTEALLEVLPGDERSLIETFRAVKTRVRETTGGQQVPWLKFDGSGDLIFEVGFLGRGLPGAGTGPTSAKMTEAEIERRVRERAEKMLAEAMRNNREGASSVPSGALPSKGSPGAAPAFPPGLAMEGPRRLVALRGGLLPLRGPSSGNAGGAGQ